MGDFYPHGIAEVDGSQPEERFQLSSPLGAFSDRRELFVQRQTDNSGVVLRLIERTTSDDGATSRDVVRDLRPGPGKKNGAPSGDAFLPLYALATGTGPRLDYSVELICNGGCEPAVYGLQTRADVARLQALALGHDAVASFENVSVKLTYKTRRKVRDDEYWGHGELQLWWPVKNDGPAGGTSGSCTSLSPPTSEGRGGGRSPASSIAGGTQRSRSPGRSTIGSLGAGRPHPAAASWMGSSASRSFRAVQTNHDRGTTVLVSDRHVLAPQLVLLLRDQDDDRGFTMLKLKLDKSKLNYKLRENHQVHFESHEASVLTKPSFAVHRLSTGPDDLRRWNLCDLAATTGSASSPAGRGLVKCLDATFLSLYFPVPSSSGGGPEEQQQEPEHRVFELEMLRLWERYLEAEVRIAAERSRNPPPPPPSLRRGFGGGGRSQASHRMSSVSLTSSVGVGPAFGPRQSFHLPRPPLFRHSLQSEIFNHIEPTSSPSQSQQRHEPNGRFSVATSLPQGSALAAELPSPDSDAPYRGGSAPPYSVPPTRPDDASGPVVEYYGPSSPVPTVHRAPAPGSRTNGVGLVEATMTMRGALH